jgi:hypothetical protein
MAGVFGQGCIWSPAISGNTQPRQGPVSRWMNTYPWSASADTPMKITGTRSARKNVAAVTLAPYLTKLDPLVSLSSTADASELLQKLLSGLEHCES